MALTEGGGAWHFKLDVTCTDLAVTCSPQVQIDSPALQRLSTNLRVLPYLHHCYRSVALLARLTDCQCKGHADTRGTNRFRTTANTLNTGGPHSSRTGHYSSSRISS